jgi:hypothetical protein
MSAGFVQIACALVDTGKRIHELAPQSGCRALVRGEDMADTYRRLVRCGP